jgi:hypothetical protein
LVLLALGCGGGDDDDSAKGSANDPFGNAPGGSTTGSGSTPGKPGDPFHGNGSTGSTAGSGSSAEGSPNCPSGIARTMRVVPRVILLLDGSCSMSTSYPANGMRSATTCEPNANGRWAALRNALVDPQNGVVKKLEGQVEFGLAIFGTQPMCPIPAAPIQATKNNYDAINGAFPDVQPGMYTPTGPALDYVYDNLVDTSVSPDARMSPQIVVLATDGEPNSCDNPNTNYQPSIDAVTKGAGLGVKTYVISLADSSGEFHDHLQQLADIGEGGTGKLYTPGNPEELQADLELLVGGAVGCDIALNGAVREGQECSAKVTLDNDTLDCMGANGFVLTDSRHIRLQGTACDKLKTSPNAVLSANFPCGSFTVE